MAENTNDPKVKAAATRVVDAAATAITTAARSTASTPDDEATRKAAEGSGKPKAYVADRDVYVGGEYVKAGRPFVTDAPEGEGWKAVNAKEVAAITASTDRVPDSSNLEAADKSALQAVAIIKHVSIEGLDKAGLITAIQAAYEPKL